MKIVESREKREIGVFGKVRTRIPHVCGEVRKHRGIGISREKFHSDEFAERVGFGILSTSIGLGLPDVPRKGVTHAFGSEIRNRAVQIGRARVEGVFVLDVSGKLQGAHLDGVVSRNECGALFGIFRIRRIELVEGFFFENRNVPGDDFGEVFRHRPAFPIANDRSFFVALIPEVVGSFDLQSRRGVVETRAGESGTLSRFDDFGRIERVGYREFEEEPGSGVHVFALVRVRMDAVHSIHHEGTRKLNAVVGRNFGAFSGGLGEFCSQIDFFTVDRHVDDVGVFFHSRKNAFSSVGARSAGIVGARSDEIVDVVGDGDFFFDLHFLLVLGDAATARKGDFHRAVVFGERNQERMPGRKVFYEFVLRNGLVAYLEPELALDGIQSAREAFFFLQQRAEIIDVGIRLAVFGESFAIVRFESLHEASGLGARHFFAKHFRDAAFKVGEAVFDIRIVAGENGEHLGFRGLTLGFRSIDVDDGLGVLKGKFDDFIALGGIRLIDGFQLLATGFHVGLAVPYGGERGVVLFNGFAENAAGKSVPRTRVDDDWRVGSRRCGSGDDITDGLHSFDRLPLAGLEGDEIARVFFGYGIFYERREFGADACGVLGFEKFDQSGGEVFALFPGKVRNVAVNGFVDGKFLALSPVRPFGIECRKHVFLGLRRRRNGGFHFFSVLGDFPGEAFFVSAERNALSVFNFWNFVRAETHLRIAQIHRLVGVVVAFGFGLGAVVIGDHATVARVSEINGHETERLAFGFEILAHGDHAFFVLFTAFRRERIAFSNFGSVEMGHEILLLLESDFAEFLGKHPGVHVLLSEKRPFGSFEIRGIDRIGHERSNEVGAAHAGLSGDVDYSRKLRIDTAFLTGGESGKEGRARTLRTVGKNSPDGFFFEDRNVALGHPFAFGHRFAYAADGGNAFRKRLRIARHEEDLSRFEEVVFALGAFFDERISQQTVEINEVGIVFQARIRSDFRYRISGLDNVFLRVFLEFFTLDKDFRVGRTVFVGKDGQMLSIRHYGKFTDIRWILPFPVDSVKKRGARSR